MLQISPPWFTFLDVDGQVHYLHLLFRRGLMAARADCSTSWDLSLIAND